MRGDGLEKCWRRIFCTRSPTLHRRADHAVRRRLSRRALRPDPDRAGLHLLPAALARPMSIGSTSCSARSMARPSILRERGRGRRDITRCCSKNQTGAGSRSIACRARETSIPASSCEGPAARAFTWRSIVPAASTRAPEVSCDGGTTVTHHGVMARQQEVTMRFMAEPFAVNSGGKVHGDAVGWSGRFCVTPYVGLRRRDPVLPADRHRSRRRGALSRDLYWYHQHTHLRRRPVGRSARRTICADHPLRDHLRRRRRSGKPLPVPSWTRRRRRRPLAR